MTFLLAQGGLDNGDVTGHQDAAVQDSRKNVLVKLKPYLGQHFYGSVLKGLSHYCPLSE
jgi:hypothetical protein